MTILQDCEHLAQNATHTTDGLVTTLQGFSMVATTYKISISDQLAMEKIIMKLANSQIHNMLI